MLSKIVKILRNAWFKDIYKIRMIGIRLRDMKYYYHDCYN